MSDKSAPVEELAATPAVPSELDVLVEDWFTAHFHNSVISQDTEFYNLVRRGIDDLKLRLAPSFRA